MTDGDTVKLVRDNGSIERIRILGIDTPEIGSADCPAERELGLIAGAELVKMLGEAVSVEIDRDGVDRYGRTLARITVDGRDLGEALIAAGHARTWTGRREDWCGAD